MLLRRIARPLLSAVFIGQGVETLRNPATSADAAQPTLAALRTLPDPVGTKVPADPQTAARINAAVQVGGGLLLATGKMPRIASAALALTVIPGSLGGHLFWSEPDPQQKAQKRRDFLTDLSLLGGLIIASADTEGKPSLGWRGRRAASRISEAVSEAFPAGGSDNALIDSELGEKLGDVGQRIGHQLQMGAERGRELASVAAERGAPLVEAARSRGAKWAETARERGADWAELARERGTELAETALDRGTELAETARERRRRWI
ncbi:hypothetical protein [Rhodococcus jostii RHA1] [Mycobacterium shimoidei]|uniref:Uncharacterized protein n=1 Tax=Mycobacterium shimoidei TaxID=29313 RepID=A0A375Z1S4_MYCSH|nr:DoxX family protein [Mycobacterium shimoidei]SRX95032.1 hypothetical protein [Rhodococcus jostii RHA1] [Mycobacterium shimoidei]